MAWTLSYWRRYLLGLVSLIPLLIFLTAILPWPGQPSQWHLGYQGTYGLGILTLIILIYYWIRVWQVPTIGSGSKLLWSVRFVITGFIALPIFWYFFVLKAETYAEFETEDYAEELDLIGKAGDWEEDQ
ncbi:MAG: hypothetical protein AAF804_14685 [Bacteroidota bacterium]